jgi:cysteine synthase
MIRQRNWAYSALAFGCPEPKLEEPRKEVIQQYGAKLELIAPKKGNQKKKKNKKRKKRRSGVRR